MWQADQAGKPAQEVENSKKQNNAHILVIRLMRAGLQLTEMRRSNPQTLDSSKTDYFRKVEDDLCDKYLLFWQ